MTTRVEVFRNAQLIIKCDSEWISTNSNIGNTVVMLPNDRRVRLRDPKTKKDYSIKDATTEHGMAIAYGADKHPLFVPPGKEKLIAGDFGEPLAWVTYLDK